VVRGGVASDGVNPFIATGNTFGASAWGGGNPLFGSLPGGFQRPNGGLLTPTNWVALDTADLDLGGSGALIVDVPGATPSKLILALGRMATRTS